jgi:hypothetical protein
VPERLSIKAQSFTESVIREMTRLSLHLNGPDRAITQRVRGRVRIETIERGIQALRKIAVP